MTRLLVLASVVATLIVHSCAVAQQQTAPRAAANPAEPAPATQNPFQLNAIQQAYLDQVLARWEQNSAQIQTFSCPFRRYEYNAFSPAPHIAASVEEGDVSYQRPDKGRFRITKVSRWQSKPVPPGHQGPVQGEYVEDNREHIGEDWLCDGKSVYQYRANVKQVVETPIPAEIQGKRIVDGPLPFLFGAEADKLKQRFWMTTFQAKNPNGTANPDVIQISAIPKRQEDAAEYQMVEIQLWRKTLLPRGMNVIRPDGSRSAYAFYSDKAKINDKISEFWKSLFQPQGVPRGWTLVRQPGQPPQAAARPNQGPAR